MCDCGEKTVVHGAELRSGDTQSCGCLHSEVTSKRHKTHGRSHTPEHNAWLSLKQRCTDQKRPDYANYGGRGIRVSKKWMHDFEAFYRHIGPRPSPRHSVERINNARGYMPGNVKWATATEQQNNKRQTVWVTIQGIRKPVAFWARERGISHQVLASRVRYGWPEERLFEPVIPLQERFGMHITIGNRTKTLQEWSEASGLRRQAILARIRRGWTGMRLLEALDNRGQKKKRT